MATTLLDFYQKQGWQYLGQAVQVLVGRTSDFVVDESLYRQQVLDGGWNALPEQARRLNRAQLRWDEILLALRREVYAMDGGKLSLRPDAPQRMAAVVTRILGGGAAPSTPAGTPGSGSFPGSPAAAPTLGAGSAPGAPPQRRSGLLPPKPVQPAAASAPTPVPGAVPATTASGAVPIPAAAAAVFLGIDLGTTYSVVCHLDPQGRPLSIANAAGDLLTPSVVLFDDEGVVVGKEAVLAAAMEPDKVADCAKRDMGAKAYRKKIGGKEIPPEVISSFVLRSLKADAERKLGPVTQAVVTVPAYFDEVRRRATMDAGRLAGLEVLDIINEPTAAAIAYGYQLGFLDRAGNVPADKPLRVLVYDLGGGTFDVTIVEIKGPSFKALATDGDVCLGGKDWDECLITLAAERFFAEHGEDPRTDPNSHQELWTAAESAKKTLTERPKATIFVNHAGKRMKVDVTRPEFEEATEALLGRTRTTTEIVVRQAGLSWTAIDRVLLVGGSTRMPQVGKMLEELTGKVPERSISPDEAVAHGAVLYADLLLRKRTGGPQAEKSRFTVTNVNSHSLGIVGIDPVTNQRRNQILIPKNTPLPHTVTKVFKTNKAGQAAVAVRVVEGESERPDACSQVGVCMIQNLPPNLPEGWPVSVSYSYEENGRLRVTAKVQGQQAGAAATFERDNSLGEGELKTWATYTADEWKRRNG
jgi:molecular chaperone DnaK